MEQAGADQTAVIVEANLASLAQGKQSNMLEADSEAWEEASDER